MANLHLVALVSVLPLVHFLVVGRHRGILNPDGLLVLSQWMMASGTLWILDLNLEIARTYAWIVSIPLAIYVFSSILIYSATPQVKPTNQRLVPIGKEGSLAVRLLFFLSLGVTVFYFVAVGYNVLLLGLQDFASGSTSNYTELRLQSYSTDRYLYPGYVNQFKNILLPSLAVVMIHSIVSRAAPLKWVKVSALALICILSLLGTGQRGAFIVFCITLVIFIKTSSPERANRRIVGVSLLAVPVILLATLLLGRSQQQLNVTNSSYGAVVVLVEELQKRVFYDNQFSGWSAFSFLSSRQTQWGEEWVDGMLGILPGHPGSSLARQVFEYLYGSDRGTAPVSMWGSVFYNWSWWGIVVFPVLLALVAARLVTIFQAVDRPSAVEAIGYAGVSAVLGNWVVGGPEFLLNAGLIASAFLWWFGRRIGRKQAPGAASNPSRPTLTSEPKRKDVTSDEPVSVLRAGSARTLRAG